MRGRASVPLSVRLHGKVHIKGGGDIAFGEGITLVGSVVPLEFISHQGAHLAIGDHTFINYGSSISAHQRVEIGDHCLLGHYTLILDNNQHDLTAKSRVATICARRHRRPRVDRLQGDHPARRSHWSLQRHRRWQRRHQRHPVPLFGGRQSRTRRSAPGCTTTPWHSVALEPWRGLHGVPCGRRKTLACPAPQRSDAPSRSRATAMACR